MTDTTDANMRDKPDIVARHPHRAILAETLRRMIEIEQMPVPEPWHWTYHRIASLKESGAPRWQCGEWFPEDTSDAFYKRCTRAIDDLEAAGLLKVWYRVSHVRLTPEGRELAEKITGSQPVKREETAADDAASSE